MSSRVTRPQGVRALLWLQSREWLGEDRDATRLVGFALLYLAWWAAVVAGCWQAVHTGRIEHRYVADVAAAAWPLWALVPLFGGGGGGEVVAAGRLAPYPVTPRAVFGAGWLTTFTDVPYVVVLPLVVGLQAAADGPLGLVAAVAFAAGASATGQLAAWLAALALAGRRRSGATAVLLTGGVVGLLTVAPALLGTADHLATVLPSGWLRSAGDAAAAGHVGASVLWSLLLLGPLPVAVVVGPRLTAAALDREARGGGAGASAWGQVGWAASGSALRALTVADIRSMVRAVGAQVALAGVLAVPALTRLPGVDVAQVSLVAMGSVAALAAATVLGLNAFAFQAGGAGLLLSWALPPRQLLAAKAASVGSCLLLGQLAVTAVGSLAVHPTAAQLGQALALVLGRTLALTGLALAWSVRFPSASDYDSLRARIAAPRSVLSYGAAAALCCYALSQGVHDLPGPAGLALVTVVAGGTGLAAAAIAARDLGAGGTERVAAGVAG